MGPEAMQKKFEEEVEGYKKLQKEITKTTSVRSQLDGQLTENKVVKEELDILEEGAVVYKLIGPSLIRQDMEEAKQNVAKRIEYITQEIKRHDVNIEKLEKDQETKRETLSKLQQSIMKAAQQK